MTQLTNTSVDTALTVRDLRKTYGSVVALDGVSLTVSRGEFFGVLGPNGAGKTTLLEILEGLRAADSGTVSLLGQSPWPRNSRLLPRLGVQTQAAAFFPKLTAGEHLTTVAALYGVGARRARDVLERFGLGDKADERVEALSGGQRQRLAIASAVAHDPEMIFLDEPTAALDPRARRELWTLLDELKSDGRTIVYTTHHLDEAEKLCDRVAILDGGRVLVEGAPRELVRAASTAPVQLLVTRDLLDDRQVQGVPGIVEVRHEGTSTILAASDPAAALSALSVLVGLENVQTRSTSLEDVYLSVTGKEYSA